MMSEVSSPSKWFWTYGNPEDHRPTHGYEATREAAMQAYATSWAT